MELYIGLQKAIRYARVKVQNTKEECAFRSLSVGKDIP